MEDSLGYMLSKYPYFLDKREVSNLYKVADVNNSVFRQLYDALYDVYIGFHLNKRILIWKEQTEHYNYSIHFVANFDNIKSVKIYKNKGEWDSETGDFYGLIYTEEHELSEEFNHFDYSYTYDLLNEEEDETVEVNIIPQDKFFIKVETWDEYTIKKGFPENDVRVDYQVVYNTEQNELRNEDAYYNHDITLDHIGSLHNIPRREYVRITDPDLLSLTIPPYNDRLTEDDYHYMQRIIEYLLRLYTTPPPVLELWKTYNVESTLVNRETKLLKLFDLKAHNYTIDNSEKNGKYVRDGDRTFVNNWGVEEEFVGKWLHKDKFCDYTYDSGTFFFTETSTNYPLKNKSFTLTFKAMDMFANVIDMDFLVDIQLNPTSSDGNYIYRNVSSKTLEIPPSLIPQDNERNLYQIIFKDKDTDEILGDNKISISVRGCDTSDYFVSPTGSDTNNDGKSQDKPFRTIQKALNVVKGNESVIVLLEGVHTINEPLIVRKPCTVMGCGNNVVINNTTNTPMFRLQEGAFLNLKDIYLSFNEQYYGFCDEVSFESENTNGQLLDVVLVLTGDGTGRMLFIETSVSASKGYVGESITITGSFKEFDSHPNITNNDKFIITYNGIPHTVNVSNGSFIYTFSPTKVEDLRITLEYLGDDTYSPSKKIITLPVYMRISDLFNGYTYFVTDMEYTNGVWEYVTKPLSEVTKLSDLNGAIMNLTYDSNGRVQYKRLYITSERTEFNITTMKSIKGLLVGLEYEDHTVLYESLNLLDDVDFTFTTTQETYVIGDTITYSGRLRDRYGDGIPNMKVIVNGVVKTTNGSGRFSGEIVAEELGNNVLTAVFDGTNWYDAKTVYTSFEVLNNATNILSDYEYIVTDLIYENNTIKYVTRPTSEIEVLTDLDNAVMNLSYNNGKIQFERFASEGNTNISSMDFSLLNGILVGLAYNDNHEIRYEAVNI